MSDERNVSRAKGASKKTRTSPIEPRPRSISLLIGGIFQTVEADDLHLFFVRRSTELGQRLRAEARRSAEQRLSEREHAAAMQRLRKEQRERMRSGFRWVRVRIAKTAEKAVLQDRETGITPVIKATRSLPVYRKPIVDRQGRRGIFLAIEYDGAGSNRFGVARRRIVYIFGPDSIEVLHGEPLFQSNMGEDLTEILACADALETVNRAARRNAKVGLNFVLQSPVELDHEGRIALLERVTEHFEMLGIPYCIGLHRPDPASDQRNFHLRIWTTFRPMVRVAPYNFAVADQLRTDLDSPIALRELRRDCAWMMTEVCRSKGFALTFTHLSNVERQLPIRRLPSLSQQDVARWRGGDLSRRLPPMPEHLGRMNNCCAMTSIDRFVKWR